MPMILSLCMGVVKGKLEYLTRKELLAAARYQRQEGRSGETIEE